MESKRPVGVTIIAILTVIGGILLLVAGFSLFALALVIPHFGILGGILIVLAIASFVVSWGLLNGKVWAWKVAIIISIISLIVNIITIVSGNVGSIAKIIIDGIVLYYLYRPNVKSYFSKSPTSSI